MPGSEPSESVGAPRSIPVTYDTLIIHMWADERMLSPHWGNWSAQLAFDPLLVREDGDLQGRLVTRWESSEDLRTWTYHLRTDVRWHDGVPLTAHDVKFTWDMQMHPPPGANNWAPGSRVLEVIDDSTVRATYSTPDAMEYSPRSVIWPRHLLQDLDQDEFWEWEFWTKPVGSGPYRYVRHLPNELLELEANPDYYRGAPPIERVIFQFGGSPLPQLLAGAVDAIEAPADPGIAQSLIEDARYRTYRQISTTSTWALYWNHRNPLFRDVAIRRALTLAVDRRQLAAIIDMPEDTPVLDVVSPSQDVIRPTPWPYDPEEARRILDAKGWVDENGDGIRERGREEFRFTAVTRGITERAAVFVQAKLAEVGVRMEIQPLSSVQDALRSGESDAVFDRFLFRELTHVVQNDWRAPVGFEASAEITQALVASEQAWEREEWRALVQEALRLFREEVPVLVLYPGTAISIAHRKVKGLATPDRVFLIDFLRELWIEGDE
jgi:peptide/nickel transport system substrate-binding protein